MAITVSSSESYFERLFNREAPGGNWSGQLDFGTGTGNGFTTAAGNTGFAYANALLGNFNTYTEQLRVRLLISR